MFLAIIHAHSTHIHAHIHTHSHAHKCTGARKTLSDPRAFVTRKFHYICTYTYKYIYTHMLSYVFFPFPWLRWASCYATPTHTYIHAAMRLLHIYLHTHTYIHAAMRLLHIYLHTHTYIHAYMLLCDSYTYLHTHTYIHSGYARRRHMKVSLYMYLH